jgi:hypothetical protein
MIGFIDTLYIHTVRDYRQYSYSAINILHTIQFTVTQALGFSVFTSHILATDLSHSHFIFKSRMKSSCHSLIPFLPLFCSCQFRRFDSIQFHLSRQAGVLKFDYSLSWPSWLLFWKLKSKSKNLFCDWRFTTNQFVLVSGPLGPTNRVFQLNSCGNGPYVSSSLRRGWVCHLQQLLASAVNIRSESRGSHDHILLSQIRNSSQPGGPGPCIYILQEQGSLVIPPGTGFPFRRLLRLAGLRWRYSNPPPHGDRLLF